MPKRPYADVPTGYGLGRTRVVDRIDNTSHFRFLRCPEMRLYRAYQQLPLSYAVGPWPAAVVGVLL